MNVVLTVGNSMMGDDGAGPLLAEMMAETPIEVGSPLTALHTGKRDPSDPRS